MRRPRQQLAVLGRERLAFGSVGDDDRSLSCRDRGQLACRREAGAAAPVSPHPRAAGSSGPSSLSTGAARAVPGGLAGLELRPSSRWVPAGATEPRFGSVRGFSSSCGVHRVLPRAGAEGRVSGRRTLLCSVKCGASRQPMAATTVSAETAGDGAHPARYRCRFRYRVRGRRRRARQTYASQCTPRHSRSGMPVAQQAGDDEREDQLEAQRAEPLPERPVRADERHQQIADVDLRVLSSINVVTWTRGSRRRAARRCDAPVRRRIAADRRRGRPERLAMPSATTIVSNTSETTPLARAVYQRAMLSRGPRFFRVLCGPESRRGDDLPDAATSRAATLLLQPPRASAPRISAAVLKAFARTQLAAATVAVFAIRLDRRQLRGRRCGDLRTPRPASAGPACCWWQSRSAARAHGDRRIAGRSCTRTFQPPSGSGPAVAMSPPRATSAPTASSAAIWPAIRSAVKALPVAPRSSGRRAERSADCPSSRT